MKTFISSVITFFIIIASVTSYIFYLHFCVDTFYKQLGDIKADTIVENWASVESDFNELKKNWNKKRKILEALSNHSKTDSISGVIYEMENHIQACDKNQLLIKTDKLHLMFELLYDDELPTAENII